MARLRCLLLQLAVFAAALGSAAGAASITRLTVEYLDAPLGITTLTPAFGWVIAAPGQRNVTQAAYEVSVSSTAAGTGDVWDSGRVDSGQSVAVIYSGPALAPAHAFFVAVRVWVTNSTQPTPYSTAIRFVTGLQSAADWDAGSTFIGIGSGDNNSCPWLRTSFTLSSEQLTAIQSGASTAMLHVAAVGYFAAFVNGARLGDGAVLSPSIVNLGRSVPAVVLDAAAPLVAGENVLGLWLGPGWGSYYMYNMSKAPLVRAELRVTPAAAAASGGAASPALIVGTDSTWRARQSSTVHAGGWVSGDYGGDSLDHTADLPGWATPAVNESGPGWEAATEYALAREILPQCIEPTKPLGAPVPASSVQPCPSREAPAGCFLVTMAELFSGWVSIAALDAPAGTRVTINVSTVNGTASEFGMVDYVRLAAPGDGFQQQFSYHEIRYLQIWPLSSPPRLADVQGLRLFTARARVGSFESSDQTLNSIYDTFARNYEGLTLSGYTVDCPHRERMGYGGDGHTSMEFAMATYESAAFFSKWAADWVSVQGYDGTNNLPNTAPTFSGGGGPGWGTFAIEMPWRHYLSYGDLRPLSATYPTMIRFLGFLQGNINASGLMAPFGGFWGFLGDWLTPHGSENSGSPESVLFNNCILVFALRVAAKIALLLGDTNTAAELSANATRIAGVVHATYYVPAESTYLDHRQTHHVMPLIAGVVPAALQAGVLASLITEIQVGQAGHLDTGLSGTYFMAKLLTDPAVRRVDLLQSMATADGMPSYAALLAAGFTTWPETWSTTDDQSKLHGCYNGFGLMFPEGALGVRPSAQGPGFAAFDVAPGYGAARLAWASGDVATPRGTVHVSWTAAGNGNYTLDLSVPSNALATMWIPAVSAASVYESGCPATRAVGVAFLRQDGNATVWSVASGQYNFSSWTA